MRLTAIAIFMTVAAGHALAHTLPVMPEQRVPVCLENPGQAPEIDIAEHSTSLIFASVGVTIDWKRTSRACREAGAQAIVVNLLYAAPKDAPVSALARAYPREGVRI